MLTFQKIYLTRRQRRISFDESCNPPSMHHKQILRSFFVPSTMISTLRGKAPQYIVMYLKRGNNQLILCTINEYKIQYILIENTTIIFEAITLFVERKDSKIGIAKACMDGFSSTVY